MRNFRIRDIFWVTSVSALFTALTLELPGVVFVLFILCYFTLTLSTLTIISFAIFFAKPNGSMLDPETIPAFGFLKFAWKYSALCTFLTLLSSFVIMLLMGL